ncbi:MAG: 16S rRNA (adenine(1518)-N(6)/adenine(1519)-N(6))-dimethyltransferase RsmA [Candidatus Diapherotrites archaeon]
MSLLGKLNELQQQYRFAPSKKFSQNFLTDETILARIVESAELSAKDTVLEIGAGVGFLTNALAPHCKKVIAVEFDEHLFDALESELPSNAILVRGDILSVKLPAFDKIVSTPPYDISSALMHKLFRWKFKSAVLVFQLEFAEKLSAAPGFHNYNAISVLSQYYFEISLLFTVMAGSFFPPPGSDSSCLQLIRKKPSGRAKNDEKFELFVEQIFRFKNKNVEKALKIARPFLEKEMKLKSPEKVLEELELQGKKVYQLDIPELVQLFNALA